MTELTVNYAIEEPPSNPTLVPPTVGNVVSKTGGAAAAAAAAAKKPKKKERSGRRNREICDVFGEAAMYNAYNISHGAQDFLFYRGFPWVPGHKK